MLLTQSAVEVLLTQSAVEVLVEASVIEALVEGKAIEILLGAKAVLRRVQMVVEVLLVDAKPSREVCSRRSH